MIRLTIIWLLLLLAAAARAQLEPLSSQYMVNTLVINPAFAGSREALSITMLHRNQWTGFNGAPKTTTLSIHAPMRNEKVGLGLVILNDRAGITSSGIFQGSFAYRIPLKRGTLALGIGAGLTVSRNSWDRLVAVDPGDEAITGNTPRYLLPDFSTGAYYYTERLFIGLSMPSFLSHDFNMASHSFKLVNDYSAYNYFIHSGYTLNAAEMVKVLPSVMIRYQPDGGAQVDVNGYVIYGDRVWAGISCRSNQSVIGLLLYQVNNQLSVAYSYDLGYGTTGGLAGASHEVMIRYEFRYILDVTDPRSF